MSVGRAVSGLIAVVIAVGWIGSYLGAEDEPDRAQGSADSRVRTGGQQYGEYTCYGRSLNSTVEETDDAVTRAEGPVRVAESDANDLERQLTRLKRQLRLKPDVSNGTAVDAYNAKVDRYNAALTQLRRANRRANRLIRELNRHVRRHNRLLETECDKA